MSEQDDKEARRRRLKQERRVQILDAATRVFASKGYRAATTREIAAEAGIDPSYLRRAAEEIDTAAMPLHGEGIDRIAGLFENFYKTMNESPVRGAQS